jgi:hypothetical protein
MMGTVGTMDQIQGRSAYRLILSVIEDPNHKQGDEPAPAYTTEKDRAIASRVES